MSALASRRDCLFSTNRFTLYSDSDVTLSLSDTNHKFVGFLETRVSSILWKIYAHQFLELFKSVIISAARVQAAPTFSDSKCNSKPLRELILEGIVKDDALASKRAIHDTSVKMFPQFTVDVICSGTGFTYLVSTTEHCEAQKDNVICFVYKRPLIR
ncbi:unnamed protein product [Heligmosomoides polygyrus]|uniref:Ground-like domain-containing protein n=1 Tax=Heligmosomoides polygyrus TaxID=6339 RepID=A0A183FJJ4_HELPZ|nr:unnamed protein product [Heligmosomoides polygyrus]